MMMGPLQEVLYVEASTGNVTSCIFCTLTYERKNYNLGLNLNLIMISDMLFLYFFFYYSLSTRATKSLTFFFTTEMRLSHF